MKDSLFVIAEAGVNHNGNPDLAFQLVDVALEAGADAIKFQTFKTENLVTKTVPKANYQKHAINTEETQFSMLKELELSYETHRELISYCNKREIDFLSTAFDLDSLKFLSHDLKLKTLKISSGDINNAPLLLAHAHTDCDLIISTGMSTLLEIEEMLGVVAFGFIYPKNTQITTRSVFEEAYLSKEGQDLLKERVTLLHCTSEYPAPYEDIDLNAMVAIRNAFGLKTGYSDHSEGISVATAATALDAKIIEKHFTLDKTLPGPDHKASLDPIELKDMITAIRNIEKAMGNGIKEPKSSELENKKISRKSLVAAVKINKGDLFTEYNLTTKRSEGGLSPMLYWEFLNTKSQNSYKPDECICDQ